MNWSWWEGPIAISLSGDRIAFVTSSVTGIRTFVQRVSELGTRVTLAERSLTSLAFSSDGRELAYVDGFDIRRVPASGGSLTPLIEKSAAKRAVDPALLPDGKTVLASSGVADTIVAVVIKSKTMTDLGITGTPLGVVDDQLVYLAGGTFTRLTTAGGIYRAPEWLPVDGSVPADTLFIAAAEVNEAILSPDERWLVLRTAPGPTYPRDIFAVDLKGDRKLQPMATGPSSEMMPRLSPDGKWLAYQSDQSGRAEVYVRPFPGEGARVQVSNNGGGEPMWDRTGCTLFYHAPNGITAVPVTAGAEFSIGARTLVLATTEPADPAQQSYDVAPDGVHFLMLRRAGGKAKAIVVHNWRRELREKLHQAKR